MFRVRTLLNFPILKCHGAGNDFPLIDARDPGLLGTDWPAVARALSDRAGPVGGDGLLLLVPGRDGAAFGMTMLNPDGTEAETCLNGLRCVARAGFEATGLTRARASLATSFAEVAVAPPLAPGVFTVEERAGPAGLDPRSWVLGWPDDRLVDAVIPALSPDWRFTAVAMPNPHLVHFADSVDEAALTSVGLLCEAAPPWLPGRANVSVAVPDGAGGLFVRTHERGAGLTDACGSAVAASVVAACLTGRLAFGADVPVRTRGGPLLVRAEGRANGGEARGANTRLPELSETSAPAVTIRANATWEWRGRVTVADGRVRDLVVEHRFDEEAAAWAAARG